MARRRTVFRNEEIPGLIAQLRPFLSEGRLPDGTRRLSGHSGPAVSLGHLPARLHESVRSAVYVVYSYGTPIAWVTEDESRSRTEPYLYHVPDVGYSPTTGQHQYAVLDAWRSVARRGLMERHGRREVVRVPGNAEVYGRTIRARSGGMDGVRPGEAVGSATGHVPQQRPGQFPPGLLEREPLGRVSAYEGVSGDAMHYSPSAQPYGAWERPGDSGYRHPHHP